MMMYNSAKSTDKSLHRGREWSYFFLSLLPCVWGPLTTQACSPLPLSFCTICYTLLLCESCSNFSFPQKSRDGQGMCGLFCVGPSLTSWSKSLIRLNSSPALAGRFFATEPPRKLKYQPSSHPPK